MRRAAAVLIAGFSILSMAPGGCAGQPDAKFAGEAGPIAQAPVKPNPDKPGGQADRKIRYTASVEVVVKDLDAANADVERVVAEAGGYVAKSEVTGSAGSRRTATWTLKVPADKYRPVVNTLAALGNTLRNASDSEDVTEEFVDLEARLKNYRVEEEALNKLLKEGAGKLEDVLKMRDQIVKTRGEIERIEGRLKFLTSVTAYSTIQLTLQEIRDYKPPTAPTFGDDVSQTFDGSVTALRQFGRGLALFAVALTPWLPVVLIGVFALRWVARRALTPRTANSLPRARPVPPAEPAPPPAGDGETQP